jgi:hypothetical protein
MLPKQNSTPQGGYDSSGNPNINQNMGTGLMGGADKVSSLGGMVEPGVLRMPGNEHYFNKPPQQATNSTPGSVSDFLNGRPTNPMYSQPATSNVNPNTNPGSFAGPNVYPGFSGAGASSGSAGVGGSGGPFPLQGQYGIVKMANGGLASAAQNMAGQGRDGDSMLVHMSPGEVKGLQALAMAHGGSLSINPDTGLVEASFLKRILPMVAGAGLMMIPGVGPLAAAGMVGGFEGLRTGDIGKGLMAGLGAYGGAGLAGSLAGTGAAAANTAATEATLAANQGNITAGEIAREMGTAGFTAPSLATNVNPATMTMADKVGSGFNQITGSPQALGAFGKQNLMNIGAAAAPVLGDVMAPEAPPIPGQPEEDPRYAGSPYRYNLSPNFRGFTPATPNPYYRPTGLGYAEGGDIMMAAGGSYDDEPYGDMPGMAAGGSIGGYSDGGRMLKGPGDGMSDSIPGVIGNKQPARLADGEFVVPADVVSHLGNGSTDAGAKKLYDMMDKIRKARTGKKKQAPAVKAAKYMPA